MTDDLSPQLVVDATRILFGLAFMARLWSSMAARELVWAHRAPRALPQLLRLQMLGVVCFTCGLMTGPACILLFGLNLYLNRAASFYGIEDISFQLISFYFLFAGAGHRLSLDRWLGIDFSIDPFGDATLGLAFLTVMFAGLLFAAGVGKTRCSLWRRGLGAYVFFLSPIYRRVDLSCLVKHERLMKLLNHLTLVCQLALLPAVLLNAEPVGGIVFVGAAVFCISLATIFTLTWIGEVLTILLPATAWTLVSIGHQGLASYLFHATSALGTPGRLIAAAIAVAIACGLWSSVATVARQGVLTRWARVVSRNSWGLSPITVFTAKDFLGPIAFRVFSGNDEVFHLFTPDCRFGPGRSWKPIFVEGMALKLAEICEEFDRYGELKNAQRLQLMRRMAEHIRRTSVSREDAPAHLDFHVLQLVHPKQFEGSTHWYRSQPWVPALRVHFNESRAGEVEAMTAKILQGPTGRDISRTTFAFSADS